MSDRGTDHEDISNSCSSSGSGSENVGSSWKRIATLIVASTALCIATVTAFSYHFSTTQQQNQNLLDVNEEQFLDTSRFDTDDPIDISSTSTVLSSSSTFSTNIRRHLKEEPVEHKPWTGSFANCTPEMKTSKANLDVDLGSHPDSGVTTISCRKIHYRAPKAEIERGGPKIVVGVLSAAAGKGPLHRDSIRSTWARDGDCGVYFIVAGPWEDVQEEYSKFRDLIWLDEEEVYEGEESVLPFKTEAFLDILHRYTLPGSGRFEYLFKTDDDSYVNLEALEKTIMNRDFDYWGCCTTKNFKPLRSKERKWMVTFELYPEKYYPLYCQGAGFAMSRKFVECISENVANFRYNPFEDVSVGLLAERCGVTPVSNFDAIKQYRTDEAGEKKQLNNAKQEEIYFLPRATMQRPKVLQHRVKTHYDMYAHYKCVQEGC